MLECVERLGLSNDTNHRLYLKEPKEFIEEIEVIKRNMIHLASQENTFVNQKVNQVVYHYFLDVFIIFSKNVYSAIFEEPELDNTQREVIYEFQ